MASQIVPVTSANNQTLRVALNVDGATLTLNLSLRYNEIALYWALSISDAVNTLLVDALPLVTGYYPSANVLQQFGYLAVGSLFVVNVSGASQDYPDATNLGTDFILVWDDTPGYVAAAA